MILYTVNYAFYVFILKSRFLCIRWLQVSGWIEGKQKQPELSHGMSIYIAFSIILFPFNDNTYFNTIK